MRKDLRICPASFGVTMAVTLNRFAVIEFFDDPAALAQ